MEIRSKSKILLISEYFPPRIFGGGELSAYELAKGLSENGLNVSVLTSQTPMEEGFEIKDGFKIYRLMKTGNNPHSIIENIIRKIIFPISEEKILRHLDEKFEIIHCLNNTSIIGCKTKRKTIATINGYGMFCPKGNLFYKEIRTCSGCNFPKFISCVIKSEYIGKMKLRLYLKYNPIFWIFTYVDYMRKNNSIRHINKFIVVNDIIRKFLIKNKVNEKDIIKIPNIMTIREIKKRMEYPLEKGTINITYIGTLDKIKGVDILIKAFNELKGKNLRLLIVGDGPERKKLENIAGNHVRFLGKIDYRLIPYIYKKSDIIVIPSKWPEPFSRVLLEATYYGKPIIATNVGGNSEGVIDGRNGFLVKPDITDIKEKLQYLLENSEIMKKMGKESRRIFKERFDRENIIKRIIEFYDISQ